jgi:hypothetical protein
MLLQEHVNQLLEIRIPAGWEQSIADAESDTDDQDLPGNHDDSPMGTDSDNDPGETDTTKENNDTEGAHNACSVPVVGVDSRAFR